MFHYKCYIFHFVIAVFGTNDFYFNFSDDEIDSYFLSNTVHDDVNDDFEFPWVNENTSQQPQKSTSQQPVTFASQEPETSPSEEPKRHSLENINNIFVDQYRHGITLNGWSDWNNLCDQTRHNTGHKDYPGIKCDAEYIPRFRYRIYVPNGKSYKAKVLKCRCMMNREYVRTTDYNHISILLEILMLITSP